MSEMIQQQINQNGGFAIQSQANVLFNLSNMEAYYQSLSATPWKKPAEKCKERFCHQLTYKEYCCFDCEDWDNLLAI